MTYTQQIEIWKRWDGAVDFGSPISAWTPLMLTVWIGCKRDHATATEHYRIAKNFVNPLNNEVTP